MKHEYASTNSCPQLVLAPYMRVSSREQRKGMTIETQRWEIKNWLSRHREWRVFDWYEDDGVTSRVPFSARPEGRRLMDAARQGGFSAVLVRSQDRLCRDPDDLTLSLANLDQAEVRLLRIHSRDGDGLLSSEELNYYEAEIWQHEKVATARRTIAGKHRIVSEGRCPGGPPPFGYRFDVQGFYIIEPAEAEIVRSIFREYAEGSSIAALARRMTEQRIPSPTRMRDPTARTSGCWNRSTIQLILREPRYIGRGQYGKTREIIIQGQVTKHERRPPGDCVEFGLPKLIDAEQWDAVQERLRAREQRSPTGARYDYPLGRLLICGCCGDYLRAGGRSAHKKYHYYVCRTKPDCGMMHLPAQPLEDQFWRRILALTAAPSGPLEDLKSIICDGRSGEEENIRRLGEAAEEIRRQSARAECTVDASVQMCARGEIQPREASATVIRIRTILTEYREAYHHLQRQLDLRKEHRQRLQHLEQMLLDGIAPMGNATQQLRRETFRLFIKDIKVIPFQPEDGGRRRPRISVNWNFGRSEESLVWASE